MPSMSGRPRSRTSGRARWIGGARDGLASGARRARRCGPARRRPRMRNDAMRSSSSTIRILMRGTSIQKVAPSPGRLSTPARPPWASAMPRTIASPSPDPGLRRTAAVEGRGRAAPPRRRGCRRPGRTTSIRHVPAPRPRSSSTGLAAARVQGRVLQQVDQRLRQALAGRRCTMAPSRGAWRRAGARRGAARRHVGDVGEELVEQHGSTPEEARDRPPVTRVVMSSTIRPIRPNSSTTTAIASRTSRGRGRRPSTSGGRGRS